MVSLVNMIASTLILGVFGALLGSFAGAQVWRLRASQLRYDEKVGEKVYQKEKHEVEKLPKSSISKDRSVCLQCGNRLQWFDLIPLLSWLQLQGKCRYCHKKIGWTEPLIEISMAVFFVVSYLFWPYPLSTPVDFALFVVWLTAGVGMGILFLYDLKWFLLPDKITFPLIGLGLFYSLLTVALQGFTVQSFMSVVYACLILSGLYYLIYVLSQHQWVGFGDVKLGLALALLLADWRLALLALFLANLIGVIIILPLLISKKIKRHAHVPFGPLFIAGWFIAGVFGKHIVDWYWTITLGV